MGMTMTQKILAAHAGLESVTAGQLIEAKLDDTLTVEDLVNLTLETGKYGDRKSVV